MSRNQIRLYDLFRKELHLPDGKAADFVLAVEEVRSPEEDARWQLLATRKDLDKLGLETMEAISQLRLETREAINQLRLETREDVNQFRNEVREDVNQFRNEIRESIYQLSLKMEQFKGDIYKSMFWNGIAQLIAILGGVLAIVKFMK